MVSDEQDIVVSEESSCADADDLQEDMPEAVATAPKPLVSRAAHILAITDEASLLSELARFEDSIYSAIYPLRVLLSKDVHELENITMPQHMSDVERWRERVLRYSSLTKTFVYHCQSSHFLKREAGAKLTVFEKEAYQKELLAGFVGLDNYLEGLVRSIDSRVNMVKTILKLDEAGLSHPNSQRVS